MPLTAIVSSISSEHVAGPMVATILVRRVLLKPGHTHQTSISLGKYGLHQCHDSTADSTAYQSSTGVGL